ADLRERHVQDLVARRLDHVQLDDDSRLHGLEPRLDVARLPERELAAARRDCDAVTHSAPSSPPRALPLPPLPRLAITRTARTARPRAARRPRPPRAARSSARAATCSRQAAPRAARAPSAARACAPCARVARP